MSSWRDATPRQARPARRPVRTALRAAAAAVALALVAACGAGDEGARGDVLPSTPLPEGHDPGPEHVHGLGVNPADGDVYAATHFGLWRLPEGGDAERVGEAFHDLMGFTVVDADHFLASGHPLLTEELPPLLGLVESTDGGQTWRSVSLLGQADFHALTVAHEQVWGWNSSDGALLASDDGEDWDRRSALSSLLDFAVDPGDPQHVLAAAAGAGGVGLRRSGDGGRTWEDADGPALARLAWERTDRLWGVATDGTVWRSVDGGGTWEASGTVSGPPEAFADAGDRLLVAVGGAVVESVDGGATWTDRYRGRP